MKTAIVLGMSLTGLGIIRGLGKQGIKIYGVDDKKNPAGYNHTIQSFNSIYIINYRIKMIVHQLCIEFLIIFSYVKCIAFYKK